jgi:hypothetical protein
MVVKQIDSTSLLLLKRKQVGLDFTEESLF